MNALKCRIDQKLSQYGELITLGGRSVRAFVQDLLSSQISAYFDESEQSLLTRPGFYLLVGADESVTVGDMLTFAGRTCTVMKIADQRLAAEVVWRVVIAC